MSTYLITGGAGFIGSHLAQTLTARGEDVVVLDDLSTGRRQNLEPARRGPGGLRFIEGDVRDLDACMQAAQGADYVLHQAALPSVQRSLAKPRATHDVNLTGGINVLEAARAAGVKRVVCASSSSAYGDREPAEAPKREDMPPLPKSPYAATKVAMEMYCQAFTRAFGLESVSLRYFNVFGPRQDPNSEYSAVIPRFLFAMLDGRRPVVYGDGLQSRDFTHVDNVVQANLLACTAPGAAGGVFNVAAGNSFSLLRLLEELGRLIGRPADPEFMPARIGDVRHSLADLTHSREILGYEPKLDFSQGLERIVALAREGKYLAS